MKNLLAIVVIFAACCPLQRAVAPYTIETRPTAIEFRHEIELPADTVEASRVIEFQGNYDSIFFEWEKVWATVTMEQSDTGRVYDVRVVTKADTLEVVTVDSFYLLIMRSPGMDSIYSVHGDSMQFVDAVPNHVPPTLTALPTDGGFPWREVLVGLFALLSWLFLRRIFKKKKIS